MSDQPTTMRDIWQRTAAALASRLTPSAWLLHVQPLTPLSYTAGVLTLHSPSARSVEILRIRLDSVIRDELHHQAQRPVQTHYTAGDTSC